MNRLRDLLRQYYGPGRRFKNARQLSLAVSRHQNGNNPNLIYDIERRGTAKVETFLTLAVVLGIRPLEIFVGAGWITEEVLENDLTDDERRIINTWRSLRPEDQKLVESLLGRLSLR